jgi:cbb3-type cytochrome oxidase subunit 3
MKNRFVVGYGVVAFLILFLSVSWFVFSVFTEMGKGAVEAEKGFPGLRGQPSLRR